MTIAERLDRFAAALLGTSSALLVLAGGNLLFAAWLSSTRHQLFWTTFWAVAGVAFVGWGILSLLELAKKIPAPAVDLMRPLLQLGALALVLGGIAWPIQTGIRWRRTGDFEAYGAVIGLIMLAQGAAALWRLARPRGEAP
jgi:hypothetical protein